MSQRVRLQEAFKLALSMALFYWFALYMDWDMPEYGGLAIVLISLSNTGSSMQKGALRIIGSTAGLMVGLLLVIWFPQSRWYTLVALVCYLTFISYFMQSSKYGYAWYVAGFVPVIVWAVTYMNTDNAFHYSVFRYLETVAGIVVYTLISALLWPRKAGDQLQVQGRQLFKMLQDLFDCFCRQVNNLTDSRQSAALQLTLSRKLFEVKQTLSAAYTDTPLISMSKASWEQLRIEARGLFDALYLWQTSIDDCRSLKIKQCLPQLDDQLAVIKLKLREIEKLWLSLKDVNLSHQIDESLLQVSSMQCEDEKYNDMTHMQRAKLICFVKQLESIDRSASIVLRSMYVLLRLSVDDNLESSIQTKDAAKLPLWKPRNFVKSLFPGLCFVISYFLWIFIDPPTGQNIPMFTAIIALTIVLTPLDPLKLLFVFMLSMLLFVSPVYFTVMPLLHSGYELLAVIFAYTFVFGYLGSWSSILKLGPIILLVMFTNISNLQSYSFMGIANDMVMMVLGMMVISVLDILFIRKYPAQKLLKTLRGFASDCAHIFHVYSQQVIHPNLKAKMKLYYYKSSILTVPMQLYDTEKKLNYSLYPDNPAESVKQLFDSVQNIVLRLQAFEVAQKSLLSHDLDVSKRFQQLEVEVLGNLQCMFESWAHGERYAFKKQWDELHKVSHHMLQQLEASSKLNEQKLEDVYLVLNSLLGLAESVRDIQAIIQKINWSQWATQKF
ncbi:MAG: FUSC family protein [Coxiellaceae bacterium]|nr:FUSC family protein [Coxiellaceae bacterium]